MNPAPDWYRPPFQILTDLGIQEPADIDIEAIAEDCGATVRYRSLAGCAARIMGYRDRAIITVDRDSPRPRQRFSAAHELGHWMRDRGQVAFQCKDKALLKEWSADNPETRANRFASDLLLPAKMFRPVTRDKPVIFETVRQLATLFSTSLTATAIRLVEYGELPAIMICTSPQGREWFVPNSEVRNKVWLEPHPGKGSFAYALLQGRARSLPAGDVRADNWLNHRNARNYWIFEDSQLFANGDVLTLLWWKDEIQLIDIENEIEERGAWRSDFKKEE